MNKYHYIRILKLVFLLFVFVHCENARPNHTKLKAIGGILDLSQVSIEKDTVIPLVGEWKFYWKNLVEPKNHYEKENFPYILKSSPAVWNDTLFDNEKIEGFGFATYSLEIPLKNPRSDLAIFIPDIGTSYRLYVNGDLLTSVGRVGVSEKDVTPKYKPQIILLPKSESYELLFHVSNFSNRWGGYWFPILLGKAETIYQKKQVQSGFTVAVCIAAALMACYNIIFFLFRKTDITPLLFSFHCVLILLRALTTGERLGHLIFDSLSWELLNRIEYFSAFCMAPVLYAFLYRFVPNPFWRRFGYLLNTPLYMMCLLIIFTPNSIYAYFLNYLIVYIYFSVVPGWFIILLVAVVQKQKDALGLFVSYLAIMYANINDTLVTYGILEGAYLIPYSQIFLIFSHSIIISKRYSNSLSESEQLSAQMKQLVVSSQRIMSSTNYETAAKSALEILSSKIGENEKLHIYVSNQSTQSWIVYSIDADLSFNYENISQEMVESLIENDQSNFFDPITINKRYFIPIIQNETIQLILDIPENRFLKGESDLDWAKAISYALVLSIQNLARHDIEKYAIIGEFSSEIAHDIGNHVILIRKSLELLELDPLNKEEIFRQTKQEIDTLSNLSIDILEFSKKNIILDLKIINVNLFFSSVKEDLTILFQKSNITFKYQNRITTETFKIDPLRIRRLCLNIAKNSLDLNSEVTEFLLSIYSENSTLYIIMEDDGPGMSEDIKRNVFDSKIESNKPHGTGLGLSIVRKIVLAHGGELLMTDRPTGGMRFTILLPLCEWK
ncbi:sensor histidine kinase [Leptospira bandrabouensis]|uniref:sensor histidine kinase n=1 Tax=Leptospira bandrabouensis TaxID=2484903 RepID=UPI001EE922EE|nr:sensor histidine kinase [Leptospira bandrabouensis]MCG6143419.1 sensor histidine kinase [Leptospira bandrabouensis]MCG6159079.1 sensor histidine kinase [Leptospira bandrabouensis]MCG6163013.1 sensor histidine kinase [Leptospira bandrabouensis]